MRSRELVRRELRIVLGARVTWLVLAASALLVGHGFVLALDLYTAASRSALDIGLMRREMDPLAGIVRPMLGGLQLCTALLVPVIAARGLAVEKERRSFGALALAAGGTHRVVIAKGLGALAGTTLLLVPPISLLIVLAGVGGHVDAIEVGVALGGHILHLLAFTAVALTCAAATQTVAQATTLAIGVSLVGWAIDAGEGFAALSWIGGLEWASVARRLAPFELGVISVSGIAWLAALTTSAIALAIALARIEPPRRRWGPALVIIAAGLVGLRLGAVIPHAYDWSEQRRVSLPPAAVDALRRIDAPIRVELHLDRDDSRRAHVQRSVIDRMRLARPDMVVQTPYDENPQIGASDHPDDYGRIVVRVGSEVRETRSTNRRELVDLVLQAAGRPAPAWDQPVYPGYPLVVEGARRTLVVAIAYLVLPLLCLVFGGLFTRIRRPSP